MRIAGAEAVVVPPALVLVLAAFVMWLTAARALLPLSSQRWWLALNVIGAFALRALIITNW